MAHDGLSETDVAVAGLLGRGATDIQVCRELGLTAQRYQQSLAALEAFVSEPVDAARPKALCERALRRRSEVRVRSIQARFEALMETAPEAILVVDGRSGIIREANDGAARLFARPLSELIGLSVEELVPESIRSVHAAYRLGFLASARRRTMGEHPAIVAERPDGSKSELAIALTTTNDADDVMAVCTEYARWAIGEFDPAVAASHEGTPDP